MEEDNFIDEMDQKRQRLYYAGIGAVVIAVLIFGLVFYFAFTGGSNNNQSSGGGATAAVKKPILPKYNAIPVTKETCEAMDDKTEKQKCLDGMTMSNAINNDNFDKCLTIKTDDIKNDCMVHVAHNLKSPDLCLEIPDKEARETCGKDVAISLLDPMVCAKFFDAASERIECEDVTRAFKTASSGKKDDIKDCANINTLEYSHLCFLNSYNSKFGGDCAEVPEQFRQYCIDWNAMETAKTAKDCDVVKEPAYKDFCLKVAKLGMTKAREIDSDNDGITDGNELFLNTDPKNPDMDGDGLQDGQETVIFKTDPTKSDTDGDGVNDKQELDNGTDPLDPKSN